MMLAEPLAGPNPGPTPFRGSLPSIRFTTGAILFVIGLSALFGLQTGLDWLSRGREDWVETCAYSAYAFMGFGALMMVSYSLLARRACWILMCAVGLSSLLHHWAVWSATPLGALAPTFASDAHWMMPVPALLLLLTGVRIWAATGAHCLAPLLDGVILGLAAASLIGYATGFGPLYASSLFSGLSFQESLGFLAIGGLFLVADVEYARLNLRARHLPAALGISAFAAVISLRISEAVLDSLGHDGLEGLLSGAITPEALALGATNTLMSVSIGVAALLLIGAHENAANAQRNVGPRRISDTDLARTSDCLNAALTEIARLKSAASPDAVGPPPPAPPLAPVRVDVGRLAGNVIAENRVFLAERGTWVLTARAAGRVHADPAWLGRALHLMVLEAARRTVDRTPLVSIRLERQAAGRIIRVSFGGTIDPGPLGADPETLSQAGTAEEPVVPHALGLADAVARWHGGRFWVSSTGTATTFNLALPGDTDP